MQPQVAHTVANRRDAFTSLLTLLAMVALAVILQFQGSHGVVSQEPGTLYVSKDTGLVWPLLSGSPGLYPATAGLSLCVPAAVSYLGTAPM